MRVPNKCVFMLNNFIKLHKLVVRAEQVNYTPPVLPARHVHDPSRFDSRMYQVLEDRVVPVSTVKDGVTMQAWDLPVQDRSHPGAPIVRPFCIPPRGKRPSERKNLGRMEKFLRRPSYTPNSPPHTATVYYSRRCNPSRESAVR